jgi:phenylacetate-CoA ligase
MLAAYLVEHKVDLGYQVRRVTALAENLLTHQRVVMEQGFGTRPLQHYGLAEGAANFSECDLGQLHVDEDYAAVEFLPTPTANVYRVVGTAFTNYAFAFLRYDVGDHVTLAAARCTCGRPGRVVTAIDGRSEDYVILRNGARVGRMDHIFKDLTQVLEAQIYQRRPGEVIFRVVRRPSYTAGDEQHLRSEALQRLGRDTEVQIDYVDSLIRGPTGKLKFVVSDLDEAKIDQRLDMGIR